MSCVEPGGREALHPAGLSVAAETGFILIMLITLAMQENSSFTDLLIYL